MLIKLLCERKNCRIGTPRELAGKDGWYAKYNQIEKLDGECNND